MFIHTYLHIYTHSVGMDVCSAVCKFFLERERNKERASAAVLAWLQCVGGSVRLWVFAARMAAQSSMVEDLDSLDVLMESDTDMPSPTPSEKQAAYIIVESADEAWPATAAAAARAAAAVLADLENTKHASDLKAAANTFHKAAEKLSEAEEMQLLSLAGEGLPPAEDKAADKDVHRPNGSEHADASDSDSILLPFNSPFRRAIEFGITEITSTFLGLPELVDAEEIVPALRLDLKTATEVEVEIAIADGLSRLEEKYVFCFF